MCNLIDPVEYSIGLELGYTQSVPIRNGPIRHTSEIFGFFKKWLVRFSKLRNPTGQFFQSKKQQRFCIYLSGVSSKIFLKIDYILKKNIEMV